jgi:hypothetical protein
MFKIPSIAGQRDKTDRPAKPLSSLLICKALSDQLCTRQYRAEHAISTKLALNKIRV